MAIDFSKQFEPTKRDRVYKGVLVSPEGKQLHRRGAHKDPLWSFTYWHPQHGTGKWISFGETPTTWTGAQRQINEYLSRGFTVHPNGHLRAPGWPYDD